MAEMTLEAKMQYYKELALQLKIAKFMAPAISPLCELIVEWQGKPLCKVDGEGNTLYCPEDVRLPEDRAAKDRVSDIARTTAEYMRLMEAAPPLEASGLKGDYRTLADFNNVVLAGHPTRYGMEFITWDRDFDRKGLSHGHYFGSYGAAKQDFAARSGLVRKDAIFTQEQFTKLYGCIVFARSQDEGATYEHDQSMNELQEQIKCLVPDVAERLERLQKPAETQMGGMT